MKECYLVELRKEMTGGLNINRRQTKEAGDKMQET
jgi:hypothetical protein